MPCNCGKRGGVKTLTVATRYEVTAPDGSRVSYETFAQAAARREQVWGQSSGHITALRGGEVNNRPRRRP